MSQQFYDKFLDFFRGFIIIVFMFVVSAELLFFYSWNQNMIFYYGYVGMLVIACFYAIRYYLQFRSFKENINLYVPISNKIEPLEIEGLTDIPLKVCLYYRNGASLRDIQEDLKLGCPIQSKKLLIKGLDKLLRFYNENNLEKVVPI